MKKIFWEFCPSLTNSREPCLIGRALVEGFLQCVNTIKLTK